MTKSHGFADEARALGADIKAIRSKWAPLWREPIGTAEDIRQVWDYRAAGLGVDRARELIYRWCKSTVGIHHPEQQVSGGRIVNMGIRLPVLRENYLETYNKLIRLPSNVWNGDIMVWCAGGRTIVTTRHEDITWPSNQRYHWPESVHVSYVSSLMTETMPHARYLLKEYDCRTFREIIHVGAEKTISHDLRGNWKKRIAEQFGLKYTADTQPIIRYKKVAYNPSTPGIVYSLYDHSQYTISQERHETVRPAHLGGLYCYRSIYEAQQADVNICYESSMLEKRIVRVLVRGKHINYDNGKEAWSYMTVLDFVDNKEKQV